MCPNCTRGLTEKKEVCEQCAGTGFWNPASLSVSEVKTMQNENETTTVEEVAPEVTPEVVSPTEEVVNPDAAPVDEAQPEVAPAEDVAE